MVARNLLVLLGLVLAISAVVNSVKLTKDGKLDGSRVRQAHPRMQGARHGENFVRSMPTKQKYATKRSFADDCGVASYASNSASKYIVGGHEVYPHSWPWAAPLLYSDYFYCGASLISDRFLITAAHCAGSASYTTTYLGSHDITQAEDTRVVAQVKRFIVHPEYDDYYLENDIALVELEEPVEFNDNIRPVCLPSYSDASIDLTDEYITVVGWGVVDDDTYEVSPVLKEAHAPVISNEECNDFYESEGVPIQPSHLCYTSAGGQGSCNGDSGGSINWYRDGKYFEVGAVSFGAGLGLCEQGYPKGNTRITSFLEFIEAETNIQIES